MTASIVVGNIKSQVSCEKDDLKTIRHNIAYRQVEMPPIPAQLVIKHFFKQRRRCGVATDLSRLWADTEVSDELEAAGLTREMLTPNMLEMTLRQRGVWDGWVRMVQGNGTFPTGLLPEVERQLTVRCRTPYSISDNREKPEKGEPLPEPPLYGYQDEAVRAFIEKGRGVIDLPPRSGKTRIAIAIVARLGIPTLYVTPGVGLVKQTVEAFQEFLPPHLIVGQKGKPNAKQARALKQALVWVATPQTAISLPNLHARRLLIIDEFHHAAASTWQDVSNAAVGAWYRLGLTGTHYRADGKDMEMAGVLGQCVFKRSVSEMVNLGRLVPASIAMLAFGWATINADNKAAYKVGIVDHGPRNDLLAYAAHTLVERGYRVLVLTKQINHAERLASLIPGAVEVDGRDNEIVDRRLNELAAGTIRCVVGTSVIGEGRDVPAADALVYAAGGRSRVKVKQDYFRVLTASPDKTRGIIIDVADLHHPNLTEHSIDRLMLYREEGCFDSQVVENFDAWLQATIG